MNTDTEGFWEARVADSLGVARKLVAKLRGESLLAGTHYRKEKNNVVLTPAGLARLKDLLQVKGEGSKAEAEAATAKETPGGPPPRRQLVVERVPGNLRLLWCRAKGDREKRQALVRVKDNTNFMPGMELEAIECGVNFWQFIGRLPRRRGRW